MWLLSSALKTAQSKANTSSPSLHRIFLVQAGTVSCLCQTRPTATDAIMGMVSLISGGREASDRGICRPMSVTLSAIVAQLGYGRASVPTACGRRRPFRIRAGRSGNRTGLCRVARVLYCVHGQGERGGRQKAWLSPITRTEAAKAQPTRSCTMPDLRRPTPALTREESWSDHPSKKARSPMREGADSRYGRPTRMRSLLSGLSTVGTTTRILWPDIQEECGRPRCREPSRVTSIDSAS